MNRIEKVIVAIPTDELISYLNTCQEKVITTETTGEIDRSTSIILSKVLESLLTVVNDYENGIPLPYTSQKGKRKVVIRVD